MKRVLITGGAGFLGSHLCDRFIAEGYHVVCMDNFITGSPDNVGHLIGLERFELVQYDVTNYMYVDGQLDAILHFASPASPIDYLKFPIQTLKSARSARIRHSVWPRPREPASCSRVPARSTAIR